MKPRHITPEPFTPAEGDIQKRAYFLWKEEGSPAGRDLDFWLKAKELVRHRVPKRPEKPRPHVAH